jgi:DNA-binding NarL/FixJ family response regulator
MNTRKILLVEDHRIMRQAIKIQLELDAPNYLIDECGNGKQALLFLSKNQYDLMITDINMPKMNGIELVKLTRKQSPNIKILTVSMFTDYKHISEMVEIGIDGYISKNASSEELLHAIEIILNDESYYSKEVSDNLIKGMRDDKKKVNQAKLLSKRELEILYLVLKEYNNKEIAEKLFISSRTVETHKYNLLQKTNSKNIAGLFKFAIQNDLFDDLI